MKREPNDPIDDSGTEYAVEIEWPDGRHEYRIINRGRADAEKFAAQLIANEPMPSGNRRWRHAARTARVVARTVHYTATAWEPADD